MMAAMVYSRAFGMSVSFNLLRFLFSAGWMAGRAIGNIRDAFLQVFSYRFARVVGVAVIAGDDRIALSMAGVTRDLTLSPVVQREGMLGKLGRSPG